MDASDDEDSGLLDWSGIQQTSDSDNDESSVDTTSSLSSNTMRWVDLNRILLLFAAEKYRLHQQKEESEEEESETNTLDQEKEDSEEEENEPSTLDQEKEDSKEEENESKPITRITSIDVDNTNRNVRQRLM